MVDPNSIGLKDLIEINKVVEKNKAEIKETIIKSKPLGEMGEKTLNQIVDKGLDVLGSYSFPVSVGDVIGGVNDGPNLALPTPLYCVIVENGDDNIHAFPTIFRV